MQRQPPLLQLMMSVLDDLPFPSFFISTLLDLFSILPDLSLIGTLFSILTTFFQESNQEWLEF
jgi:hypothetical protein